MRLPSDVSGEAFSRQKTAPSTDILTAAMFSDNNQSCSSRNRLPTYVIASARYHKRVRPKHLMKIWDRITLSGDRLLSGRSRNGPAAKIVSIPNFCLIIVATDRYSRMNLSTP